MIKPPPSKQVALKHRSERKAGFNQLRLWEETSRQCKQFALKLVSALELRKGMGGSKNREGVREAGNVTSVSLARGSWD